MALYTISVTLIIISVTVMNDNSLKNLTPKSYSSLGETQPIRLPVKYHDFYKQVTYLLDQTNQCNTEEADKMASMIIKALEANLSVLQ